MMVCCLSMFSHGLITTSTGPLLMSLKDFFKVSSAGISLLYTFMSVGSISAVLISSYLIRKTRLKTIGIAAQSIMVLALYMFSFSKNIYFGIAFYIFIGLSGGLLQVVTNTTIASIHSENRASALSFLHFSFGLGAFIGPLAAGLILQNNIPWEYMYYLYSIFSILIVVIYLFIRFPSLIIPEKKNSLGILNFFRDAFLVWLILSIIIYVGIEMGINSWAVNYIGEKFKTKTLFASSILSYFWFFMTVGRLLCIYLTRKFHPVLIMVIFIFLSLAGLSGFVLFDRVWLAFVSVSLIGLSFSGLYPIMLSIGGNRYPEDLSGITYIIMLFSGAGIMVFPLLLGFIRDHASIITGMNILLLFDAFLAAIAVLFVLKYFKKVQH